MFPTSTREGAGMRRERPWRSRSTQTWRAMADEVERWHSALGPTFTASRTKSQWPGGLSEATEANLSSFIQPTRVNSVHIRMRLCPPGGVTCSSRAGIGPPGYQIAKVGLEQPPEHERATMTVTPQQIEQKLRSAIQVDHLVRAVPGNQLTCRKSLTRAATVEVLTTSSLYRPTSKRR